MCTPTAAVQATMGVVGAASQASAAGRQARSQGEYNYQMALYNNDRYNRAVQYQQDLADWQEENYYKTAASAQASARGQYATVLEQIGLVRDKTLRSIASASRAAQKGRSFVLASASETGTQGTSVQLAQQQYELQEARHSYISYKNLETAIRQSERNLLGIQAQAQNRINQAMPAPMAPIDPVAPTQHVQSPSMMPYIIQGGSSIINAAAWQNNLDANAVQAGTMDAGAYAQRWGGWTGHSGVPSPPTQGGMGPYPG
tara:strand:- start:7818 stop:8591 length:774 start_codon:yes stop_codon:yes gene_type:complete